MNTMKITEAKKEDLREITLMSLDLFKDHTFNEMYKEFSGFIESETDAVFISKAANEIAGFIQMSLREDYVEGSHSSPVAYVEGIYVKEAYRKNGIARQLVNSGEEWAKKKGCSQIASDIEIDNTVSHAFHLKAGFKEVNKLICFLKDI